jgi:predicted MFS family arabinose efflux permease
MVFFIFILSGFASALSNRSMDPLLTLIARDFAIPVTTAALLSSAYAFPNALSQPVLGPVGDFYGKTRVMKTCLWLLAFCITGCILATSFEMLIAFRLLGGVAAGGVMPVAMAILGDKYPPHQRQLAIGRFLTAGLTGIIFGASLAGIMAVSFGWRSFLYLAAGVAFAAAIGATLLLSETAKPAGRMRLSDAIAGYRQIFANPKSWLCFGTVFLEAIALYGCTPFIGELIEANHLGTAREAGFVLAGIGIGGIIYSLSLPITLRLLRRTHMMALGGSLAGAGLLGMALILTWPLMTLCFTVTGFGFMMLHNSVQAEVAELAPAARASAFSMHSCSFFLGQAIGPIVFGFGLHHVGRGWLILNMALLAATGIVVSRLFARHPSASGRF